MVISTLVSVLLSLSWTKTDGFPVPLMVKVVPFTEKGSLKPVEAPKPVLHMRFVTEVVLAIVVAPALVLGL